MTAMNRRLQNELCEIRNTRVKLLHDLQVNESDILSWEGVLLPENPPYNKGGFRIQISFPNDYPFKPPSIVFKTKIYHPNIDENGQVCLSIICIENWKPATKICTVISKLIKLINEPEPGHPLRTELAEEYQKNKKKFLKNADEHTRKFAEKRTSE